MSGSVTSLTRNSTPEEIHAFIQRHSSKYGAVTLEKIRANTGRAHEYSYQQKMIEGKNVRLRLCLLEDINLTCYVTCKNGSFEDYRSHAIAHFASFDGDVSFDSCKAFLTSIHGHSVYGRVYILDTVSRFEHVDRDGTKRNLVFPGKQAEGFDAMVKSLLPDDAHQAILQTEAAQKRAKAAEIPMTLRFENKGRLMIRCAEKGKKALRLSSTFDESLFPHRIHLFRSLSFFLYDHLKEGEPKMLNQLFESRSVLLKALKPTEPNNEWLLKQMMMAAFACSSGYIKKRAESDGCFGEYCHMADTLIALCQQLMASDPEKHRVFVFSMIHELTELRNRKRVKAPKSFRWEESLKADREAITLIHERASRFKAKLLEDYPGLKAENLSCKGIRAWINKVSPLRAKALKPSPTNKLEASKKTTRAMLADNNAELLEFVDIKYFASSSPRMRVRVQDPGSTKNRIVTLNILTHFNGKPTEHADVALTEEYKAIAKKRVGQTLGDLRINLRHKKEGVVGARISTKEAPTPGKTELTISASGRSGKFAFKVTVDTEKTSDFVEQAKALAIDCYEANMPYAELVESLREVLKGERDKTKRYGSVLCLKKNKKPTWLYSHQITLDSSLSRVKYFRILCDTKEQAEALLGEASRHPDIADRYEFLVQSESLRKKHLAILSKREDGYSLSVVKDVYRAWGLVKGKQIAHDLIYVSKQDDSTLIRLIQNAVCLAIHGNPDDLLGETYQAYQRYKSLLQKAREDKFNVLPAVLEYALLGLKNVYRTEHVFPHGCLHEYQSSEPVLEQCVQFMEDLLTFLEKANRKYRPGQNEMSIARSFVKTQAKICKMVESIQLPRAKSDVMCAMLVRINAVKARAKRLSESPALKTHVVLTVRVSPERLKGEESKMRKAIRRQLIEHRHALRAKHPFAQITIVSGEHLLDRGVTKTKSFEKMLKSVVKDDPNCLCMLNVPTAKVLITPEEKTEHLKGLSEKWDHLAAFNEGNERSVDFHTEQAQVVLKTDEPVYAVGNQTFCAANMPNVKLKSWRKSKTTPFSYVEVPAGERPREVSGETRSVVLPEPYPRFYDPIPHGAKASCHKKWSADMDTYTETCLEHRQNVLGREKDRFARDAQIYTLSNGLDPMKISFPEGMRHFKFACVVDRLEGSRVLTGNPDADSLTVAYECYINGEYTPAIPLATEVSGPRPPRAPQPISFNSDMVDVFIPSVDLGEEEVSDADLDMGEGLDSSAHKRGNAKDAQAPSGKRRCVRDSDKSEPALSPTPFAHAMGAAAYAAGAGVPEVVSTSLGDVVP